VTSERTRDAEELRHQLSVFTRLASSFRNAKVRDEGLITAVEHEIDLLRDALGIKNPEFRLARVLIPFDERTDVKAAAILAARLLGQDEAA
jgi:hypothetical protein